jgi:hypothetical protein
MHHTTRRAVITGSTLLTLAGAVVAETSLVEHPEPALADTASTHADVTFEPRVLPGTAFTYQGLLESGGAAVTTAVDLRFTLYEDAAGTIVRGGPIDVNGITPDDGVFSASIDFGAMPFDSAEQLDYWMRIEVSPAGANTYDDLGIQALDATPFALNTRGLIVGDSLQAGFGTIFNNVSLTVRQRDAADFPFVVQNVDGTQQSIVVDADGNTGLGTLNPANTLTVAGSADITDDLAVGTEPNGARFSVESPFAAAGLFEVMTDSGGDFRYDGGTDGDFFIEHSGLPTGATIFGLTGGARLLKIQNDGNIGINTDTPLTSLDVRGVPGGTARAAGLFRVTNCGQPCGLPADTEAIRLWNDNANGRTGIGFITQSGADFTDLPDCWIGTGDGPNATDFTIKSNVGGVLTPYMTIEGSNGNVKIDEGDLRILDGRLSVNQTYNNVTANVRQFGTDPFIFSVEDSGGTAWFTVEDDGDIFSKCGALCSSDARLKKNVRSLDSALDDVLRLRGVTFTWRDEKLAQKGTQLGFIAQEVEDVLPELVGEGRDGFKAVQYASLTPVLVEAIKEQQAQIDALQARLDSAGAPVMQSSLTWPALGVLGLGALAVARRRSAS